MPPRLWDYGLIYKTNILNRIPRGQQQRNGIKLITGKTSDISEWLNFEFYNRVWYYDQKKIEIDESGRRLARWLGVAVPGTSSRKQPNDYMNDDIRREVERFEQSVEE